MSKDIETLKELYATKNYVCYGGDIKFNRYWLIDFPNWKSVDVIDFVYKLIHKKDAEVAKAIANDSSVEVERKTVLESPKFILCNFFDDYCNTNTYRLKEPKQQTISISDGEKEYVFIKPDFEVELLKVVGNYIYGLVYYNSDSVNMQRWEINTGRGYLTSTIDDNLTPLPTEKEWWECEDNFPMVIKDRVNGDMDIAYSFNGVDFIGKNNSIQFHGGYYRPLTKVERDSLYCSEVQDD